MAELVARSCIFKTTIGLPGEQCPIVEVNASWIYLLTTMTWKFDSEERIVRISIVTCCCAEDFWTLRIASMLDFLFSALIICHSL